jgi:hypothetical protein
VRGAEKFDHDDDSFDTLLSASQHEAPQTRIGPLDIHRVRDGRRACLGIMALAMPELPQSPAADVRKSQSPRRINASRYPSLGAVNRTAKNRFAKPFA